MKQIHQIFTIHIIPLGSITYVKLEDLTGITNLDSMLGTKKQVIKSYILKVIVYI